MAKSSSSLDNEVYDDSYFSKSCRKNTVNLNTKISKLNKELSECETDLYNYKRGLSQVEARLVEFKENEVKYYERIRVLERDVDIRDNKIKYLKNELEHVKKEKESLDNKLTGFGNASKDLDNLLGSQRLDKNKEGLGYSAVHPPPAQIYSPPKKDLSWTGLPEFVDDTLTDYLKNQPRVPRVFITTEKIPTVDSKFPTTMSNLTADLRDKGKAVKASARWIWRPKRILLNKGNLQNDIDDKVMYRICTVIRTINVCTARIKCNWHNNDFHQIVDFLKASHVRYALTISPTIYVSHIRQFWSTAMIETTNQETKIIDTVDGKPRTIYESSLKRHLKLNDEEGISSLPDVELFENLSLMGYNILPNQRFTFQKGQFSHQWKFLVHTIMQCLSPKSTGFNEFSSNIATDEHQSPQSAYLPQHDSPPLSHQTLILKPISHDLQASTETLTPRRLTKRAIRIAQSKSLSSTADEPVSLSRDDRHGEAFLTVSSLDAGQDRENIAKTSAMSHESSPRVSSLDADEGSMQQRLYALMEQCTSLQRQQYQMADNIKDQDIEISGLKARVKSLENKKSIREEPIQEDAPITGGIIDIREELGADKNTEKGSNDTEEMVNVLSSMEAANILSSGGAAFSTVSVSPVDVFPTAGVPTVSGSFPTGSAIFTTASVATPYKRRSRGITIGSLRPMRIKIISVKDKRKEKVTETEVPKKKKLQEQIEAQVAREMETEFARENQRSNEVIAKHLSEYKQAKADLSVGEKIELISELVKYQDHLAEILKYQAHQSKPSLKKEQRRFYMSVLKSHAGWKTEHFKGMTLE
nr:hypothetical protein [Tanacetum cinerariifolium]